MNKFLDYQLEMYELCNHKIKKSHHILKKEDYQNFAGFTAQEIWGEEIENCEYENWLKEQ